MLQQIQALQYLFDLLVCLLIEWVDVLTDCTLQQEGLLRNVGNALSEKMETQSFDVDAVDQDLALVQFTQPEEGLQD